MGGVFGLGPLLQVLVDQQQTGHGQIVNCVLIPAHPHGFGLTLWSGVFGRDSGQGAVARLHLTGAPDQQGHMGAGHGTQQVVIDQLKRRLDAVAGDKILGTDGRIKPVITGQGHTGFGHGLGTGKTHTHGIT